MARAMVAFTLPHRWPLCYRLLSVHVACIMIESRAHDKQQRHRESNTLKAPVKRIIEVAALAVGLFALVGCVEIFQYVGYDDEGNLDLTITVKMQKALFKIANQFSESGEELDYRAEFGLSKSEIKADFPEWRRFNYSVEQIDTPTEYGLTVSFSGQDEALLRAEESIDFLPRHDQDVTTIEFTGMGGGFAGGAEDEFAAAFLAGAKYRLLVSKNYITEIEAAVYEVDESSQPVEVNEFKDVYLLELPLADLLMSEGDGRIRITH